LRDDAGIEHSANLVLTVSMVEDDPGSGKMIECLTLKGSTKVPAGKYDPYQTDFNREYTIEIFAENENRPPRYTFSSSRDLEKKHT
jgi:hypothetical protein